MPFPKFGLHPKPAPPGFGQGKPAPDAHANILDTVTFSWLTPLMRVGWSRPLEEQDLWEIDDARRTESLADALEKAFYDRAPPFKRPISKQTGQAHDGKPSTLHTEPTVESFAPELPLTQEEKRQNYDMSLVKAIYSTFTARIWVSGSLLFVSSILNITTPIITKLLIQYITDSFNYAHSTPDQQAEPPKGAGYGIGLAIAIFAMQQTANLCHNASYFGTLMLGFALRTSLISNIFRKSLRLSGRARMEHTSGQITTLISADTSRLDSATGFIHVMWSSPLLIAIGIALLIVNLGPCALIGLATLVLSIPIQGFFVGRMMKLRRSNVESSDKRMKLLQEILQGIRILVFFNWRGHYMSRVVDLRRVELKNIRRLALLRGVMTAMMAFVPILAAILTFVAYSLTGHTLDAATIFSSLQLFNAIKGPLTLFPLVAAALSDGLISLNRIRKLLLAEEQDTSTQSLTTHGAVSVHGSFTWESGAKTGPPGKPDKKATEAKDKAYAELLKQWSKGVHVDEYADEADGHPPFTLQDLTLDIKPGAFVAVVGRVGSGKSSLLEAITGVMRCTMGSVALGGTIAYSPQQAWIQNLSLRENIVFGSLYDDDRFRDILHACALEHDVAGLPDGVETDLGERGVNLSGGQKARISLARAAYQDSDIVLLDDPLAAVDANVSRHIVDECLLSGPLANKTRILVTHQLHVLPRADKIIYLESGRVVEQGTFTELISLKGAFATLVEEFGLQEQKDSTALDSALDNKNKSTSAAPSKDATDKRTGPAPKLFTGDERTTGAVSGSAYVSYLRAAGGLHWAFILLAGVALAQAATVVSSVILGFWTEDSLPGFTNGRYMALYAGLGLSTAFLTFFAAIGFAYAGYHASLNLFTDALRGVLFTNLQWHEKTPTGAITSRLSKDIDTLDSTLPRNIMTLLQDIATIFGTVALVFYSYAWLGLMFPPLAVIYWFASSFYRHTSVEIRRIDSRLRTMLYAAFTEALTGVSTVRAYRAEQRFVKSSESRLDSENRASLITRAAQCWLSIRMELLSNLLVLGVGLFAVGFRHTTEPAKMAVVLTYALSLASVMMFTAMNFASVETDMNAVERIEVYKSLPEEVEASDAQDIPDSWPTKGSISFQDVKLRYRPDLPFALNGISFEVKPGEKVGIVGRTGAGKSSLVSVLFRVAPALTDGNVLIDGVDIAHIRLETLREKLAIIPQDAIIFDGPLRANLDPADRASDAQLHASLKRVGLSDDGGKFELDRQVRPDSFSAGEKQLLAMCRAVVKADAKILVLDEPTSNVDVMTDAIIQQMLQTDFKNTTVLCIAHRLSTIAHYDRVLVLQDGSIAEYDSPLSLYDASGVFRSLCDQASLTREEIVRARDGATASE